jgi:hypothetical protein
VGLAAELSADESLLGRMLHDPVIVNGMLIVIAVITLTFAYRNLRHHLRRSGDRRPDARSRPGPVPGGHSPAPPRRPAAASGPRADATAWVSPPPRATAAATVPAEDYPSWPGRPGPTALHPDHPSWPGRPDPRWTAFEQAWADDGRG